VLANKHGQETFRKITHIKHIKIIVISIVTHTKEKANLISLL